jgi:hypothetical protein
MKMIAGAVKDELAGPNATPFQTAAGSLLRGNDTKVDAGGRDRKAMRRARSST